MDTMKYHADIPATKAYWEENQWQCTCLYCQNYRNTFVSHFPEAANVLEGMGLQYDHALEIVDCYWNDRQDKRIYEAYYPVQGTLQEDGLILCEKDPVITLYQSDSPKLSCPKSTMKEPYFMAVVSVQLPWEMAELP